ncbi:MAG TPA: hypothetical protein VHN59_19125 [Chitinophagaceae bacterium]|nr:hypothetical protein [Chitinophagaceae bacterium]
MLKRHLLSVTALLFSCCGFSQSPLSTNTPAGNKFDNDFAHDVNGRPIYLKAEYIADGSPYLYDNYCMAEITVMDGKVYPNVKAKIDLQEKLLLYMLDNGTEMIMTSPVKRIKFYNYVSNGITYPERTFQGHLTALNAEGAAIYEVLVEDSAATLLKQITVTFNDSKGYGETSTTRIFKKAEHYFAAIPSQSKELRKVEKNKSALASLFGSKAAAISTFIEQKKLKCKSDQDLTEVFRYYCSL